MPTQMGRTPLPVRFLEDDDGHVGDRIHHQASNLHFEFHGGLPLYFN